MGLSLPLFVSTEIADLKAERERLSKRLQNVRMDARSRIRTEQRLSLLTAKQIQLEATVARGAKAR